MTHATDPTSITGNNLSLPVTTVSPEYNIYGTAEQVTALQSAYAAARKEFKPIEKYEKVSYTGRNGRRVEYKFAPHDELERKIFPALAAHGLSIRQPVTSEGDKVCINTVLSHGNGGFEVYKFIFRREEDIKDLGGQMSYYKRYALQCLVSVSGEDAEVDPNYELGASKKDRPAARAPKSSADNGDSAVGSTPTKEQRAEINQLMTKLGLRDAVKLCADVCNKQPEEMLKEDADTLIAFLQTRIQASSDV